MLGKSGKLLGVWILKRGEMENKGFLLDVVSERLRLRRGIVAGFCCGEVGISPPLLSRVKYYLSYLMLYHYYC